MHARFTKGDYTLGAIVTPVAGEKDSTDNSYIDSIVIMRARIEEACELAKTGFNYFTAMDGVQIFRKRK